MSINVVIKETGEIFFKVKSIDEAKKLINNMEFHKNADYLSEVVKAWHKEGVEKKIPFTDFIFNYISEFSDYRIVEN